MANRYLTSTHSSKFNNKFHRLLKPFFTLTQINYFLNSNKKITKWSEDDICSAIALRSISPKAYKYLKYKKKIPLPCISTLNKWVKDIKVEPGILNVALRVMGCKELTVGEKACILAFDEMSVSKKYEYDKASDRIYVPHKSVQVIIARGILGSWRQPVYFDYDKPMSNECIIEIIRKMEHYGFPVHGIVCDLGGSNRSLFNQLDISENKSYFENPFDNSRNIHVFADVPHLIKLIRNNLLTHGINVGGNIINSNPLFELVAHDQGDFKIAYKISRYHLTVKGSELQNVKTAVNVMSETVGNAIKYLGSKGKLESNNWQATANFILLVDKWFDLLNSSGLASDKFSRRCFRNSADQRNILEEMINTMKQTNVLGKTFPFIKGIIISSLSLMNLFSDLEIIYDMKYIITRRLNQDVVENFFGIIRQMGGANDHPSSVVFKQRLKKYIIGGYHSLTSCCGNTNLSDGSRNFNNKVSDLVKNSSPIKSNGTSEDLCLTNQICSTLSLNTNEDSDFDDDYIDIEISENMDGFKYVLGYIVFKYKETYQYLIHDNENVTGD